MCSCGPGFQGPRCQYGMYTSLILLLVSGQRLITHYSAKISLLELLTLIPQDIRMYYRNRQGVSFLVHKNSIDVEHDLELHQEIFQDTNMEKLSCPFY